MSTIAINESVIDGGPLPEGDLFAYSYDPLTSCVFLVKKVDYPISGSIGQTTLTKGLVSPGLDSSTEYTSIDFSNVKNIAYPSTIYLNISKLALHLDLEFNLEYNEPGYTSRDVNVPGVGIVSKSVKMKTAIHAHLVNGLNTIEYKSSAAITTYVEANGTSYSKSIVSDNTDWRLGAAEDFTMNIKASRVDDPGHALESYTINYLDLLYSTEYVRFAETFDQLVYTTSGKTGWAIQNLSSEIVSNGAYVTPIKINSSWGFIEDGTSAIVCQTLAPFPPPFYDPTWYNAIDYAENTGYGPLTSRQYVQDYSSSETLNSTPSLDKLVKIIDDQHARQSPTCYSIALITQEDDLRQLFWRCLKETRTAPTSHSINKWVSSEKVYKYKSAGVFFGGKDYSGPLNSIHIDVGDGSVGAEYKILDLNEFPINEFNETYVDAFVCNYSTTSPKIYCLLNKLTGRMAEIDVTSKTVKYFTLDVTTNSGSSICQLYYTNRLMYTVKNADGSSFMLYDANNNGVYLHTFTLGSYDPNVASQFSIIN